MAISVKRAVIGAGIFLAAVVTMVSLTGSRTDDNQYYEVQNGLFEVLIAVTGELEAENSVMIPGPQELRSRNIRLSNVPILDLVPEGTEVEAGDWVATLDRTEAELSLRDLEDQLLSQESQFAATQLDTTIMLRGLRDELINLEHSLEENELIFGQSVFEPPATIRQAEINLERARIELDQARENYVLIQKQAVERMTEASLDLDRHRRRFEAMSALLEKFVITAPQSGMVIYHREWNGSKRTVGSTINSRDLTVAVMPELTSLVSRALVSEIDINRISVGQNVRIGMDAFPGREYSGRVVEISNVGQEMPNTDAKVFEILIKVDQIDGMLRPAMTTSNIIVAGSYEDVNYVPLAAVHWESGVPFVYRNDGTRQIVVTGPSNDNFVIIEKGLEEGELVYLSKPENHDEFKFVGNELVADRN